MSEESLPPRVAEIGAHIARNTKHIRELRAEAQRLIRENEQLKKDLVAAVNGKEEQLTIESAINGHTPPAADSAPDRHDTGASSPPAAPVPTHRENGALLEPEKREADAAYIRAQQHRAAARVELPQLDLSPTTTAAELHDFVARGGAAQAAVDREVAKATAGEFFVYPAKDFGLTEQHLEAMLEDFTQIHPNGPDSLAEKVVGRHGDFFESNIADPVQLGAGPEDRSSYALVSCNVNSERKAWLFQRVLPPKRHTPIESWGQRRQTHKNIAPEDVPLEGVRATVAGTIRVFVFGPDSHRITLTTPRTDDEFDKPTGEPIRRETIEKYHERMGALESRPPGQKSTWFQWRNNFLRAVDRLTKGAMKVVLLDEPGDDVAGNLYRAGHKPAAAAELFVKQMPPIEIPHVETDAGEKKLSEDRQRTIDELGERFKAGKLKVDPRPLMIDQQVNDHGVYVHGVQKYKAGAGVELHVVQSMVDRRWRWAVQLNGKTFHSGSGVSVAFKSVETRNVALWQAVTDAIDDLTKRANAKNLSKSELQRVRGMLAAAVKFKNKNPHAQVKQQPAADKIGFRPQTFNQWAATVKGIGGPDLLDIKLTNSNPDALAWWMAQHAKGRRPAEARDDWKNHKGGDFSAASAAIHALHTKKGATK